MEGEGSGEQEVGFREPGVGKEGGTWCVSGIFSLSSHSSRRAILGEVTLRVSVPYNSLSPLLSLVSLVFLCPLVPLIT